MLRFDIRCGAPCAEARNVEIDDPYSIFGGSGAVLASVVVLLAQRPATLKSMTLTALSEVLGPRRALFLEPIPVRESY